MLKGVFWITLYMTDLVQLVGKTLHHGVQVVGNPASVLFKIVDNSWINRWNVFRTLSLIAR